MYIPYSHYHGCLFVIVTAILICQAVREFALTNAALGKLIMSCSQVFNLCNLLHSFLFQDIPGIVAFLSAKDIPGKNSFIRPGLMMLPEDEEVQFIYIYLLIYILHGPVSSVSIVTEQWAGRSGVESRWGRDFLPIQTSPGAHPAS